MKYVSVSIAQNSSAYQQTHFKPHAIRCMRDMKAAITQIWSPIVYKNGIRKGENFLFSDYAALDFDDTLSLNDAIGKFKDYTCLIYTTKNHLKYKNNIYAERFRVILPFNTRITSPNTYKHNLQLLINEYQSDKSCSDTARFFFPCVDLAFENINEPIEVQPYVEKKVDQPEHQGINTPWLQSMILRGSCGEPGRNTAGFKLACAAARCGLNEDEIYNILRRSYGINTLSEVELRGLAKSGYGKRKSL